MYFAIPSPSAEHICQRHPRLNGTTIATHLGVPETELGAETTGPSSVSFWLIAE